MSKTYDVIIVGAGPAGIFTALELTKQRDDLAVLLIEKGNQVGKRICPAQKTGAACRHCTPCATLCGWGGAGAFSDGKLTLSPDVGGLLTDYIGRQNLADLIHYVDRLYLDFGAPEHIYGPREQEEWEELYRKSVVAGLKVLPLSIRHLGTGRCADLMHRVYENLAGKVDVLLGTTVERLVIEEGTAVGVETAGQEVYWGKHVVATPGREGAEWLTSEAQRLQLQVVANPVDIGVRVELPAVLMEHLTKIFYELKCTFVSRTFEDNVRTFCMNPFGKVVMENIDGLITVNGHTHAHDKTANTNFAILVSKGFTEPFKEPIAYGRYIARLANLLGNGIIVQRLGDLIAGRRSTPAKIARSLVVPTLAEATPGDLSLVFPYRHLLGILEMLEALDQIAPGVYSRDTLLYGVEVKFYSSRLTLNRNLETPVKNLFAAGDGAGVTRGLMQASVSGVIIAREILKRCG